MNSKPKKRRRIPAIPFFIAGIILPAIAVFPGGLPLSPTEEFIYKLMYYGGGVMFYFSIGLAIYNFITKRKEKKSNATNDKKN